MVRINGAIQLKFEPLWTNEYIFLIHILCILYQPLWTRRVFLSADLYLLLSIDKFSVQKVSSLHIFFALPNSHVTSHKSFSFISLRKRFLNQFGVCRSFPKGISALTPLPQSCTYQVLQTFEDICSVKSIGKI